MKVLIVLLMVGVILGVASIVCCLIGFTIIVLGIILKGPTPRKQIFPLKFFKGIGKLVSRLTGEFSWAPPQWLNKVAEKFKASQEKPRAWISKNKKLAQSLLVIVCSIIIVGTGFYVWYQSRPQPTKLIATITAPQPTKLQEVIKPDPVRIHFSGSAARLNQVGKEVTDGIQINPAIHGTWEWVSDRMLIFTPQEDWAVGEKYTVQFDRLLFPEHILLKTYTYEFQSAPFTVSINEAEFYQDPRDPSIKRVVATVTFSHAVDPTEFEKNIVLKMKGEQKVFLGLKGKLYPYTVTYDEFKGEAYIHSDVIKIPLDDKRMVVRIEKGVRAERGGTEFQRTLEQTVKIPGMYNYFLVESSDAAIVRNERYEAGQVLVLTMTTGALEAEIQDNLSVYLLPKDRPPVPGDERIKRNFRWRDVSKIGPEILHQSEKVAITPIPTDREFATIHSFKFEAQPKRALYVKLDKGVQSYGGYVLAKTYDTIIKVPEFQRELRIMHDGAILSLSGDKKISVLSNGLEAIRASFARVLPKQINHLVSQTGGQFKSPHFRNYRFSPDNITEVFTKEYTLVETERPKTQYTTVDFSDYLTSGGSAKHGLFFLKVQSWDPRKKVHTGMEDKRLLLITDMGLLVKEEKDGSRKVFVQSIPHGRPISGVRVDVIGKNGIAITSRITGAQGSIALPPLSDFKNEKTPTAIIARKGTDLSFIPYDWPERRLSFSRFDTGGVVTSLSPKQLQAYLFSDRGIYRPGDEIRVGFIVKRADWKLELAGVPLETVVIDSRALEIQKRKIRLSTLGFEEIRYTTEENSPTGSYQFRVYIVKDNRRGSLLSSLSVKVEEFLPDRMKITTRFSHERREGWVAPDDLTGLVSLRNLFGTPAKNRRIAASMSISPHHPYFINYRDYTFIDPNRKKEKRMQAFTDRLEDKTTDKNGEVAFEFDLDRFERSFYRLSFFAEGYEAQGGRAVSSESSVFASDLPYLLGYKPDGDLGYIKRGSKRSLEIIAINSQLQKIDAADLNIHLIEQRYVSSLVRQRDNTYKYQSVEKEVPISSRPISISATGLRFELPTDTPGHYILSIRDNKDFELLRAGFSVVGEANLARSLERNAELQLKLNKSDYTPGEIIEMQITAPYTGAGVITIERDKVYAYKWFKTYTTNSVQSIRVPNELEGNGYVNVAFVRSMDSPEIFMSPLSYAAVPFTVSLKRRINRIELGIPALAQPGEPYRIKYKGDRHGKVIIVAVDEGILQVARYNTPDPLAKFFEKRALEVRSSQIVDLILPEFHIFHELFSKSGGFAREALSKNLNPFKRKRHKPVAYWSGIKDISPQWSEVAFDMPDYFNGTVRIMAVSVTEDTIGVAEKKGLVRGPFVLSPNVPTFVAPGDEFEVSVGVHNNVEGSGTEAEVTFALTTSKHLEIIGEQEQTLKIAEGREGVAKIKIRARDVLGSANCTFTASLGEKKSKYSIGLSVRPPMPYMTTVTGGHLKGKKDSEIQVSRKLYPHFRILEASASIVPVGLAHGLNVYLSKFPYLCTEQLVSRTVPVVVLRKHPEFGYNAQNSKAIFNRTVKILYARQNSEGAFGFWAANSHVSPFQTVYALHFLTEARDAGYPVPQDLLNRGRVYLRHLASQKVKTLSEARVCAYAIYVLTRQQEVSTQHAKNLENWLKKNCKKEWRKDITGIYLSAVYIMHRMESQGLGLIAHSRLGDPQEIDYNHFYDGLLRDAIYLYIVAKHFPKRLTKIKGDELLHIVNPVVQGHFNTTNAAFVIMALGAYVDAVGYPEKQEIKIIEILEDGNKRALVLPQGLFSKVQFSDKAVTLLVKNLNEHLLFYQMTQAGFDSDLPEKQIKENMEIYREYREIEGSKINKAKLGDQIEVHLAIRSLDKEQHNNVAVVDLLPGGFEVVIDPERSVNRNARIAIPGSTWDAQYADVREDRVILFGTVGPEVEEFVYKIRATNKGEYRVPPSYGESMYNRSIKARGLAETFEITD